MQQKLIQSLEHKKLSESILPIDEAYAISKAYEQKPYEAYLAILKKLDFANTQKEYYGKWLRELHAKKKFKTCTLEEKAKIDTIISVLYQGGLNRTQIIPDKYLNPAHRLKARISGHRDPDLDSHIASKIVEHLLHQTKGAELIRIATEYQESEPSPTYIKRIINRILTEDTGTEFRNFDVFSNTFASKENYYSKVKDIMTVAEDCFKVKNQSNLAQVLDAFDNKKFDIIIVTDAQGNYVGDIRKTELLHYLGDLYKQNRLIGSTSTTELQTQLQRLKESIKITRDFLSGIEQSELIDALALQEATALYLEKHILQETLKATENEYNVSVAAFLAWKKNHYALVGALSSGLIPKYLQSDKLFMRHFAPSIQHEQKYILATSKAALFAFLDKLEDQDSVKKLREAVAVLREASYPSVLPTMPIEDKKLDKLLEEHTALPVLNEAGELEGIITAKHRDNSGVINILVDTNKRSAKLKGLSHVVRVIDHHPKKKADQQLNPDEEDSSYDILEPVGSTCSIVGKVYLNFMRERYMPKQFIKLLLVGMIDDTDGLNTAEKKAKEEDIGIFEELCRAYFNQSGFTYAQQIESPAELASQTKALKESLEQLILEEKLRFYSEVCQEAEADRNALRQLCTDVKSGEVKGISYWVGQIKNNLSIFTWLNKLDFVDWWSNEYAPKNIKEDLGIYMVSGDRVDSHYHEQKDELLIYTRKPTELLQLAQELKSRITRSTGEAFADQEIQTYRRIRTNFPKLYFDRTETQAIFREYSSPTEYAILERLFFINDNGTLSLRREILAAETEDTEDLTMLLKILLRFYWSTEPGSSTEILKDKNKLRPYIEKLFNPNVMVLKYPQASVTTRKRQLIAPIEAILAEGLDG